MLGHKVALGAVLLTALQIFLKVASLISLVVMARLLTPADFGLVAIAVSVLAVVNAITDLSVSDALVQRDSINEQNIDSAFTLGLLRGVVVSLALNAGALPISYLYEDARLAPILSVVSLSPFIASLSSPAVVFFLRRFQYGPVVRLQLISQLTGFSASVTFVIVSQSYWSLIIGQIVSSATATFISYVIAPYRPRLRFRGSEAILRFSIWMALSRVISTVNLQSDRFLLGHILGKPLLGQYTVGSDMASIVTYSLAAPIMQTMFGGFSRLQTDTQRIREAFLRGQQLLVFILLPLGFGLSIVSDRLVPALLGPNWDTAVIVVVWLAPVISLQTLYLPMLSLAMAMGNPRILVVRETLNLFLRAPLTIFGAYSYGILGATIARAIGGGAMIVMTLTLAKRFIDVSAIQQIGNVWRSLISVGVMVVMLQGMKLYMGVSMSEGEALCQVAVLVGVGAVVYLSSHVALWLASNRPEGAESFILEFAKTRLLGTRPTG